MTEKISGCPSAWADRLLVGAALIAGLVASGCAHDPGALNLMPAPAVSDHALETLRDDSAPVVVEADDTPPLDMLYATDRAPAVAGDDDAYYTGERGYLLRVGGAQIVFGDTDVMWDEARKISLLKNRPGEFPLQVKGATELGILADSVSVFTPVEVAGGVDETVSKEFVDAIEHRLERTSNKDLYVYVHGYKVSFENPLLVASELWHFLGHEGAFVAFSWPSTPARLAYLKDIETARVSAWGLRKLIEYLARETTASRIHIVGYSAGTRVVLTALYELALIHQHSSEATIREKTKLGNVILVGSDVDTGMFASYILDGLLRVQEHLTIYASPSDKALHLSEKVFAHRRLGETLPGTLDARMREFVAASSRLAFIDVSGAENFDSGNGHAYFRKSPWVSADVLMNLRYNLKPSERGLVRRDESPIWRFPVDYPQRLKAKMEHLNPQLSSSLNQR